MRVSEEQLKAILPHCASSVWVDPINSAMAEFRIDPPKAVAMFLAQTGHESAHFTRLEENLNYSAERLLEVFDRYFDEKSATAYAHDPRRIANKVYANRMGNGDEASGDGYRHRGRGVIQLTGRSMYAKAGRALGIDLLQHPEYLTKPILAARSGAWFFVTQMPGILLAQAEDVRECTRRINRGLVGLEERRILFRRACRALGVLNTGGAASKH